jgi:3' exoribonuclease, RNase T-like
MKIFYDCEFVEDGNTIDLISIGMVREDGDELYVVSAEFDQSALFRDPWLVEHVWPFLPKRDHRGIRCQCLHGHLDVEHPDVRPRAQIARLVEDFVLSTPDVELWAWYGAYDHVALCRLYGPMNRLPEGMPMWTADLQQESVRLGKPTMPEQAADEHHALADARHVMAMHQFLTGFADKDRGEPPPPGVRQLG